MNLTACYKNNMETPLSRALEYLIRTNRKVTQKKVADSLDLSQPYISDLKKGKREGSLDTWEKIAKLFGMSYGDFYTYGEKLSPTILSGELPIFQPPVISLQDESDKRHAAVIAKFENKDFAVELNEMLVEIEKLEGTTGLVDAKKQINYVLMAAREKKGLSAIQMQKTGTNQL